MLRQPRKQPMSMLPCARAARYCTIEKIPPPLLQSPVLLWSLRLLYTTSFLPSPRHGTGRQAPKMQMLQLYARRHLIVSMHLTPLRFQDHEVIVPRAKDTGSFTLALPICPSVQTSTAERLNWANGTSYKSSNRKSTPVSMLSTPAIYVVPTTQFTSPEPSMAHLNSAPSVPVQFTTCGTCHADITTHSGTCQPVGSFHHHGHCANHLLASGHQRFPRLRLLASRYHMVDHHCSCQQCLSIATLAHFGGLSATHWSYDTHFLCLLRSRLRLL